MSKSIFLHWQFSIAACFVVLVFLIGGGARPDIPSLAAIRPLAAILCGAALLTLTREDVRKHIALFALAGAIALWSMLQLVPLPPSFWHLLPGRELMVQADRLSGSEQSWRPVAMVPWRAWNALFSLLVPLAVLLLGCQLSRDRLHRLFDIVLAMTLLSGCLGLLQVVGNPQGPLYFYAITNPGEAVGLFANRNHHALLLAGAFPILAAMAATGARSQESARARAIVAVCAAAVLIFQLLITGSRAGLACGLIGLALSAWVYRRPPLAATARRTVKRFDAMLPVLAACAIAVALILALVFSRARAVDRLLSAGGEEDRFAIWPVIARQALEFFPVGSGAGSFAEVFRIREPDALLSTTYYNHAHNDWLELVLTMGLPGLALLLFSVVAFLLKIWRSRDLNRQTFEEGRYFRAAAAVVCIFALGSIVDYPLRVPSLSAFFALLALLVSGAKVDGGDASAQNRMVQ